MLTGLVQATQPDSTSKHPAASAMRWDAWGRILLLGLILAGFARLLWALDAKNLWWDESLSLQRAEAGVVDIIIGRLALRDGLRDLVTYDQHPFFYFLIQGSLLRLAGTGEFVLRLPSVMAATFLIPLVWIWGKRLTVWQVAAPSVPYWAALIAAAHPYYLWYGQEARPYALWAVLALLSTYCLARAIDPTAPHAPRWWIGYAVTAALFYMTHYYAVFLLPVQALMVALWLWRKRPRLALGVIGASLLAGAGVGLYAYWSIVIRQAGGGNFPEVAWSILFPDLINAFTFGLSVDITKVWWLDLLFAAVALLGAITSMGSWERIRRGGWLPVALVLGPVAVLLVANLIYPAYMNARHMSLIGGSYILLLALGLGALTQPPWPSLRVPGMVVAGLLALVLLVGMGQSTRNYFTLEEYAKDDFDAVASYMNRRLAPGDVLLIKSPFVWRIFSYYLNVEAIEDARANGVHIAWYGVPLIRRPWEDNTARIDAWAEEYRRVWLVLSNTFPYVEPNQSTEGWMDEHLFRVQQITYFSHSSLQSSLYLHEVPVYDGLPPGMAAPVDVTFGNLIKVVGVTAGPAASDALAAPVTLAWETAEMTPHHYKYILKLVEIDESGGLYDVAVTEREPYDGAIPTIYWEPGKTIVEYTELPPTPWPDPADPAAARYRVALQVYQADTLEKLPVTEAGGFEVAADGVTLLTPYWLPDEAGR